MGAPLTYVRGAPQYLHYTESRLIAAGAVQAVVWMGKKRITVTVDEDLHRWLETQDSLNTSALINQFIREYRLDGEIPEIALMKQKDRLEAELEQSRTQRKQVERRIEMLEEELELIEELLDETHREVAAEKEEVLDMIEDGRFRVENLTSDNPAITNYATKAGVAPERLVEAVESELNGDA